MPEPLRSPKQSRVAAKNRSHPYSRPTNSHRTRDVGLSRSNSVLSSLKSFVTAPFSWLSLGDSQESNDSPQKRRVSGSERGGTPPTAKRVRRDSPEAGAYLDPPSSLFPKARPLMPVYDNLNGVAPVRTMSLDPMPRSTNLVEAPLQPSRKHSVVSRISMSVEPQSQSVLRRSMTREFSMPPPSPFARSYARSSLTPQPSGATFGPSPKRKPRESTAPPLLPSPAPTFTRPPPSNAGKQGLFPRSQSREASEDPISVLLGRTRQSMSPVRETSSRSLLARDEVPVTRSSSKMTVERTLSALESYRTPLHTSRFPSVPPTGEHRPRKVHVPIPSNLRFDHTPEGRKEKAKRGPTVVGPYSSGMSGMRKLLARRREELDRDAAIETDTISERPQEVEVEKEGGELPKEKTKEIEVDEAEVRKGRPQVNGVESQLPRMRSPPRSKPDGPYSSLRAPSNKVSRTHALAPRLKKARNKFALDDDDDTEWSMSVEDVKNYQAHAAQVQPPISFIHTRSMSEAGMQTETDNARLPRTKTPPLPSQPQTFDSLLSRIGPPTSAPAKPTTSFPVGPASPTKSDTEGPSQTTETAKIEASSAPATLPFSFSATASKPKHVDVGVSPFASNTATPAPSPSPVPAPPTSNPSGVPSFFANTKTQFTPPKVPSGSLFGSLPSGIDTKDVADQPKNAFGGFGGAGKGDAPHKTETQKEPKPSPFGEVSKPSTFGNTSVSVFGADSSRLGNATSNPSTDIPSPFSGFGTTSTSAPDETSKPTFSFGTRTGDDTTVASPGVSIFGAASKPDASSSTSAADALSKRAFSFPATPTTTTSPAEKTDANPETAAINQSSKRAFSFDARPSTPTPSADAPKSQFSFGAPSSSTQPTNTASEAVKSPFAFGAAPSMPAVTDKKPAFTFGNTSGGGTSSGFSFGSNSIATGAVDGASSDAPKTVFAGFGNISTPSNTSSQKTTDSAQAETGDGMEVNGGDRMEESPTRTSEKKDTPASQLAQISPFAGFGTSSNTGGFSFGQDKPSASAGSFSFGQSKPSTSTGFNFGQTADKSTTGATTGTGFSFGQDVNKPTSTLSSTGFAFGNDASKSSPVQSPSSFGAPLNNPFGGSQTSSSSFSFGQANTRANPFGQPQQPENGTSSAPNSPSLFPQQAPQSSQTQSPSFSFNVPASNPFSGSNTTPGLSTTSTTQPFQFGVSGSTQQQPQQQQQQQQQSGAAGGSTMFTLGGAATPPRKVKGLPTRRARRP